MTLVDYEIIVLYSGIGYIRWQWHRSLLLSMVSVADAML